MLKIYLKQVYTGKGQSTVEYILLVTAVIAVSIVFLKPKGTFQKSYNASLTGGANAMEEASTRLWKSMAP